MVGWAQTPMTRRTDLSESQLLTRVITDALDGLGLTRADIDFTCQGSCDYITGQAFSFVQNIDAIGAWPPKRDSHVEMDGAWALYEAWLRLQEGDIEIAVVTGSGRSSTGDPALIYPMEMDPYYLAPLGVDPVTFAALQARAVIAAGIADERSMAEVALRSRHNAIGNEFAQVQGDGDIDTLLAEDYVREPLRRHDLPPITDGAVAVVLATAERAQQLRAHPAWITGIDHRTECHNPMYRELGDAPSVRIAGKAAGLTCRRRGGRRAADRLHPRGAAAPPGARTRRPGGGQCLGRSAGLQPDHGQRPGPHRLRGGPHLRRRPAGTRPCHFRAVPATEPDLHTRGRFMSHRPCAIVGVGQTHHKSRRLDVSYAGLVREAAFRALDDAHMTFADIDAVVVGKAPDLFEGVMKPELYLSDALGGTGKPFLRVHTAGSVGATTGIVAASHVSTGKHDRVLAVAFEKQSEGNAQFALGSGRGASLGAGGAFAPYIKSYIHRSGAPEHIGWKVAVKDRQNALKNPFAHLKIQDISLEKVKSSPMLWEPLRYLESCPSSDGACAIVIGSEEVANAAAADGRPPAWFLGTSSRSEPSSFPGRDPVLPQACVLATQDVYKQAGITDPRRQIDMAELYVPFSWYEAIWLEGHGIAEPGEGWRMIDSGETELTGAFPVNASGGVLSSNPIGASGLLRVAEAANQVRGMAGEHQVDGAKVALGMAYGAANQYFSLAVLGSSLHPFD